MSPQKDKGELMVKDSAMDELNKMISINKEKEFLDLEETEESLPPELVGTEPIDDMIYLFDETDIQILAVSYTHLTLPTILLV